MDRIRKIIDQQTTLVVKVGTHLLADKEEGINNQFLDKLAENTAELRAKGIRVALVTSGAIGAGVAALGLSKRPTSIPEKQATAAVGQPLLMEAYEHAFRTRQMQVAQILLTKDDFTVRRRYVNARNTFEALFDFGVIPIINENDTVAVEEIKLGDNDNLSAMVATLIDATMLILLSDIDGLYDSDPHINRNAKLIHIVETITPQIEQLAKEGITTMEAANEYLRTTHLPRFNAEFMRPACEAGSAFVPYIGADLREILCEQHERVVGNDNCVHFNNLILQLPPDQYRFHYPKSVTFF